MQRVREIVEIGHALRKEANVPVRQPLLSMSTSHKSLLTEFEQLIMDEMNVKTIKYQHNKNELDLTITPELKEEADARELIRKIQDARKQLGVMINQKIVLTTPWMPESKKLKDWIINKTLLSSVKVGEFRVDEI